MPQLRRHNKTQFDVIGRVAVLAHLRGDPVGSPRQRVPPLGTVNQFRLTRRKGSVARCIKEETPLQRGLRHHSRMVRHQLGNQTDGTKRRLTSVMTSPRDMAVGLALRWRNSALTRSRASLPRGNVPTQGNSPRVPRRSASLTGRRALLRWRNASLKGSRASLPRINAFFKGSSASLPRINAFLKGSSASLPRLNAFLKGSRASLPRMNAFFARSKALPF